VPEKKFDKQKEVIKQFRKFGFAVGATTKTGAILVELRGNDPVRVLVNLDGSVLHVSGDVTRFDWGKFDRK
jgi:hypothetical protein